MIGPPLAPGPTADDVAAAQDMTPEDRSAMIQSMVDRLASRLKQGRMILKAGFDLPAPMAYLVMPSRRKMRMRTQPGWHLKICRSSCPMRAPVAERHAGDRYNGRICDLIEHIRALAPTNPDGLFFGGLIAYSKGDAATAKNLWSDLLELMGPDTPARGLLEERIEALGG